MSTDFKVPFDSPANWVETLLDARLRLRWTSSSTVKTRQMEVMGWDVRGTCTDKMCNVTKNTSKHAGTCKVSAPARREGQRGRHEESATCLGRGLLGRALAVSGSSGCLSDARHGQQMERSKQIWAILVSSSSSSWRKSGQTTRLQTMRMAGPSTMRRVSTMWRTFCCARLRIVQSALARFLPRRRTV